MDDLTVHFSKTTQWKGAAVYFLASTRGTCFKTEGEEKLLKHLALETTFGDKEFLGPFYQTDSVLMMTWFSRELLGENGGEYRKLVLIYTEVSHENGSLSFFFYDLKGSMHKNQLPMWRSTLLHEIIRFNEVSNFLAQNRNDSPLCSTLKVFIVP